VFTKDRESDLLFNDRGEPDQNAEMRVEMVKSPVAKYNLFTLQRL